MFSCRGIARWLVPSWYMARWSAKLCSGWRKRPRQYPRSGKPRRNVAGTWPNATSPTYGPRAVTTFGRANARSPMPMMMTTRRFGALMSRRAHEPAARPAAGSSAVCRAYQSGQSGSGCPISCSCLA
jgi:hypothetical protein